MYFEPFYSRFPEVAKHETRGLLILNDEVIPEDEYALIEAYCNQPNCDCRRDIKRHFIAVDNDEVHLYTRDTP